MKSYLLETSFIIDYLKNKEYAVELLHSLEGSFTSSVVCLAELYEGVNRSNNKQQQENILIEFFNNLDKYFPIEEEVAKKFGELRARLKQQGNIIEDMDIFIAATCLVHDLTLLTLNKKHFTHVRELKIL